MLFYFSLYRYKIRKVLVYHLHVNYVIFSYMQNAKPYRNPKVMMFTNGSSNLMFIYTFYKLLKMQGFRLMFSPFYVQNLHKCQSSRHNVLWIVSTHLNTTVVATSVLFVLPVPACGFADLII